MAEVLLTGQNGGGAKINGVVEQFKVAANENIAAGDFVELTDSFNHSGAATLTMQNNGSVAVQLSEDKVLLLAGKKAMVLSVAGGTITTLLTKTNLFSAGTASGAVLLPSGKVFVMLNSSDDYYEAYGYYCAVVTVTDIAITKGSEVALVTASPGNGVVLIRNVPVILLPSGKVFVAYTTGYSFNAYKILAVSGDTITAGASGDFDTYTSYTGGMLGVLTSPSTVVLIGVDSDFKQVKVKAFRIAEAGTVAYEYTKVTILNTEGHTYYTLSAITLPTNKVALIGLDNSQAIGKILSVGESSITSSLTYTVGNSESYSELVWLRDNKYFAVGGVTAGPTGNTLTITDNAIASLAPATVLDARVSYGYAEKRVILLPDNRIFISYGRRGYGTQYALVTEGLQAKAAENEVSGIAKAGGSGGASIGVYIPN